MSRKLFDDERILQNSLVFAGQSYYKIRDILKAYQIACGYPVQEYNKNSYNLVARKLLGKTLDEVREYVVDGRPVKFNS